MVPGPTSDPTAALPKRPIERLRVRSRAISVTRSCPGGAAGTGEYVRIPPLRRECGESR